MKIESALIIAAPEAEPLVKAWRERFDSSAATGVPAHITILYPFMPPGEITSVVLAELREFFAQFAAFDFALTELQRFPTVLYLSPLPVEPFKDLISAVVERYPAYPPYGGAFSEVIPHLTIADVDQPEKLDDIEREFLQQHGAQLPVKACVHEVLLLENSSGRWETRQVFGLTGKSAGPGNSLDQPALQPGWIRSNAPGASSTRSGSSRLANPGRKNGAAVMGNRRPHPRERQARFR